VRPYSQWVLVKLDPAKYKQALKKEPNLFPGFQADPALFVRPASLVPQCPIAVGSVATHSTKVPQHCRQAQVLAAQDYPGKNWTQALWKPLLDIFLP